MSSWIIRGGPGGRWEQYSLDANVTAVGWSTIGDLDDVGSKEELQGVLDAAGIDEPSRKTTMLWAFIREIQPGDIVVMPRTGEDVVAIGEVTGDYRHDDSGHPEARHVHDVTWLDTAAKKIRFAADLRTYFDLPATLTAIRKARDPDGRLRNVATSDLPDGYEPGGPLQGFSRPAPLIPHELDGVPEDPSVHVVWDPDGALLYIGYTGGPLRQRLSHHVRGDRQASILHQRIGELLDAQQGRSATGEEIAAYLAQCTIAWATRDDPEALKEQLIELLSPRFTGTATGRNYWWVNQGQTYQAERDEGCMWAPLQNEQGVTYKYWSALKQTRAGDLVYHYAGGEIRAVGFVTKPAREAPKPFASDAWQQDGYLVEVEYLDLDDPISLDEIPNDWRTAESAGPFNVNGGVKQGYLFPLSQGFAAQLARRFSDRIPGETSPPPRPSDRRVWMFQGNPQRWPIDEMLAEAQIGMTMEWAVVQHKRDIRSGDLIVLWMAGPEAGIYALAELVTDPYEIEKPDEFGDTKVKFRWLDILDTPLLRHELEGHPVLAHLQILRFRQSTNYPVTPEQWYALQKLTGWQEPKARTMDWLEEQTLWDRDRLQELVDTLTDETYQVVLAGPPGTGKTYVAQLVAEFLTASNPGAQRLVQFHPSYSYEEFIEGLRPVADEGTIEFRVEPGVVIDMCAYIDIDAEQLHVLVIDEMNRANLSSVFGELMYLFEYRDQEINLRFTRRFALPSTLRFIGTMNTADRSARSIDIALRRRFDVFECPPDPAVLERFYKRPENTNHVASLFAGFDALNARLTELRDRHHTIGHAFFMAPEFTIRRLRHVWDHKILPLLEEYFLDQPDQVAAFELATFWPEATP